MKNLDTIIGFFKKRSLISLAHSLHRYNVEHLQRELSDMLRKQITVENVDKWLDNNPILNDTEYSYFDAYDERLILNRDNTEFLSSSQDEPDYFKIEEVSFLPGSGEIPNLYKIKGKKNQFSDNIAKMVPSDLGHYGFIIGVINGILNQRNFNIDYTLLGMDAEYVKIAVDFIKNNKSKIDSLFKMFEYYPKRLGSGLDGVAFDVGKNKVLKLYTTQSTHQNNLKYYNKLYDSPEESKTEMMVYDIGSLGTFNKNMELYYIITEKMKPVNELDYNVMHYFTTVNNLLAEKLRNELDSWTVYLPILKSGTKEEVLRAVKEIKDYSEYMANDIDLTLRNDQYYERAVEMMDEFEVLNEMPDTWLPVYVEEVIMKALTRRGDLHSGNVGLNNAGYFRFFDSYHELWENGLNMGIWRRDFIPIDANHPIGRKPQKNTQNEETM